MNDFLKSLCALRLPRSLVTRLGVCVQNKTERKLDSLRAFYYDVLLLTTAYSAYAVHFFLGQFPNMELMLLLLSPLFYLLNCYIFVIVSPRLLTQFLTGCLCVLNYMSKLDHLISLTDTISNLPQTLYLHTRHKLHWTMKPSMKYHLWSVHVYLTLTLLHFSSAQKSAG